MASIPFARRPVSSPEDSSLVCTDDARLLQRDKEIRYRSSSGVESYKSTTKSRTKKSRNIPVYKSTTTSEAEGTSSAAEISCPSRKRLREAFIASPVQRTNYGSVDEKQPLLSDTDGNEQRKDIVVDIPSADNEAEISTTAPKKIRFWSVVMFILLLIAGLSLVIAVNVRTDSAAREITPSVFHYYNVVIITVFMLLSVLLKYHHRQISRDENVEPLIPSHLLNGLALFGACNSAFQVLMIVDIVKCSRSVSGLDKSYIVTAVFEILFVYCQIYVFYTLSRRRKQKPWFENFFTMFTLAVNLTIWAGYFCASAINNDDLKDVSWLRHYYYGKKEDLCANQSYNTGGQSRMLHGFVNTVMPYKFTFAMEYSLLASALLLHKWREIAAPAAGEFGPTNKKWDVWRCGFIVGLFSLPLQGVIAVYSTVEFDFSKAAFLYSVQFVLFLLIFFCSVTALLLFKSFYVRVSGKTLKIDIILLCSSSIGFLVIDSFTIFATCGETLASFKSISAYSATNKYMLGFTSLVELVAVFSLTTFIVASYFFRVPLNMEGIKAAKSVRQIGSFCLMVSFGFWVMRTYTFRSSTYFDFVGREYFGAISWFVITQFSVPMCIFYHFHCAVCLSGIIADSTVAGGHVICSTLIKELKQQQSNDNAQSNEAGQVL